MNEQNRKKVSFTPQHKLKDSASVASRLLPFSLAIMGILPCALTPNVLAEDVRDQYQRMFDGIELRVAALCFHFLKEGHPLKQRKPVIDTAYVETLDRNLSKQQFSKEFAYTDKMAKKWLKPYIEDNTFPAYCSSTLKSAWESVYKYTGIDYRKY